MNKILSIIISIASIFAVFYFFRWVGIKGMISFIAGIFITVICYENNYVKFFIDAIIKKGER